MASINQVEQCMPGLMEKYNQLQSSIEQRLKWASGANPALHSVLKNFDETVAKRKNFLLVSVFMQDYIFTVIFYLK